VLPPCQKQKLKLYTNFIIIIFLRNGVKVETNVYAATQPPVGAALPSSRFHGRISLVANFVQDKCYSNKVWAKLYGLPAREVRLSALSRCKRALDWQLWVGKNASSLFAGLELKIKKPLVS
jgi:hypothetical protein